MVGPQPRSGENPGSMITPCSTSSGSSPFSSAATASSPSRTWPCASSSPSTSAPWPASSSARLTACSGSAWPESGPAGGRRFGASQTWRTFLANHLLDLVSIDFFTVPTARLRVLFVLVMLAHHRRRVVHFNVTEHPRCFRPLSPGLEYAVASSGLEASPLSPRSRWLVHDGVSTVTAGAW